MKSIPTLPGSGKLRSAYVLTAKKDYNVNLTALGLTESLQARRPSELYFPAAFNPQARTEWLALFEDELFQQDLKAARDNGEAWFLTVTSFMDTCAREGIDPFKPKDSNLNQGVRNMLFNRRIRLQRYIDRSRLFQGVKLIPNTAKHDFRILPNGNLIIQASVVGEHKDKAALETFIRNAPMRMLRTTDNRFSRNLLKNLTFYVSKITSRRATFSYTLEVRPPFYLPPDLKKAQYHDYFDKEFFFPLVRGFRFNDVPVRIKF